MNVYKHKSLRRINARVHHLIQGFPSFLTDDQIQSLKTHNESNVVDYLQIAQYEQQLNLLAYLDIQ